MIDCVTIIYLENEINTNNYFYQNIFLYILYIQKKFLQCNLLKNRKYIIKPDKIREGHAAKQILLNICYFQNVKKKKT